LDINEAVSSIAWQGLVLLDHGQIRSGQSGRAFTCRLAMTSTSASQGLLEEIAQRLEQGRATAQRRVEEFDRRDLDEESEDSLRDLAIGLRNDLHHIQGLLEEVLTSEIPPLRGRLI
jgi:hypothetical protein